MVLAGGYRPLSNTSPRLRQALTIVAVYLVVLGGVFGFSVIRARLAAAKSVENNPATTFSTEPFFSLTANRTFAPTERARISASYRSVDHLDFRVYAVNDPLKFFKQ